VSSPQPVLSLLPMTPGISQGWGFPKSELSHLTSRQRDDVAGTKETIPKSSVRSRPAADVVATAVGQPTHPAAKGTVSILDIYFRCGDDNLVWFKVFVVFLL